MTGRKIYDVNAIKKIPDKHIAPFMADYHGIK